MATGGGSAAAFPPEIMARHAKSEISRKMFEIWNIFTSSKYNRGDRFAKSMGYIYDNINSLKKYLNRDNVNDSYELKNPMMFNSFNAFMTMTPLTLAAKIYNINFFNYLMDELDAKYSESVVNIFVKKYFAERYTDSVRKECIEAILKLFKKSGMNSEQVKDVLVRLISNTIGELDATKSRFVEELIHTIVPSHIRTSKWNRSRHLIAAYNSGEKKTRKHSRRQNRRKSRKH